MPTARRFFITGRQQPDAVQVFAQRLARAADGTVTALELGQPSRPARPALPATASQSVVPSGQQGATAVRSRRWRFVPADATDVVLARALCAEYDVGIRLWTHAASVGDEASAPARPELLVDPSRLDRLTAMGQSDSPLWCAQAGVRLATLVAAGLTQFAGWSPTWTLAQWAASAHPEYAPGECAASGVVGADVLFADGTTETLGDFGVSGRRPLKSARAQASVPALFRLMQSEPAAWLRALPHWPAECRLDALAVAAPDERRSGDGKPQPGAINLSQVFLGHAGRYVWVMQWLLRPMPAREACARQQMPPEIDAAQCKEAVALLHGAMQHILDEEKRYIGTTDAA